MNFRVTDLGRCKAFYIAARSPLGYAPCFDQRFDNSQVAGLGHADPARHDRAAVDAFQAAGSTDGNAPGLQPRHRAHCYGAYVFGPDGNNVEAVCHAPA